MGLVIDLVIVAGLQDIDASSKLLIRISKGALEAWLSRGHEPLAERLVQARVHTHTLPMLT